ncbi:MAG: T9SS type A sorting domain-containing protein [Chitinophagales bacterium]|nr:T9SS type A sorting domain-containing protein [Chitinophagales bacterium]
MKTKILPLSYYLRALFVSFCTLVFFLLSIVPSYCQSETHNFTTYDTTFSAGGQTWIARISRPVNMFTPNHPDTASRPALITMPGVGEVGTNYSNLTKYGPHFWLNNGWDGSIVTGNGTHYPILITVISSVANPRVNRTISMLQFLLSTYHIKSNSVHLAGLSMGAFTWAGLINGQLTNGGEEGMRMVTSLVLLQGAGQGATSGTMGSAIPYDATGYSAFGHWASKYGGTFFGLEGTADTRNVWQPRDNINDSVPGAGYFAFENIGGGAHCCWNTMYDPNRRNWKCLQNDLGTNIVWNTIHNNSMGTYQNGWNVFEWMLRQGDTTLVGTGTNNATPVANAGVDQTITLPVNTVTLNGSGTDPDGTIVSYQWSKLTGPSQFTIVTPVLAQTIVNNLVEGVYEFKLTIIDNQGATGSDTVTVTVNPVQTSNPSPSGKKIAGPGEYQNLFIDADGHLWGLGNIGNIGTNNTGTPGIAYRVNVTPSDLKFKMCAGGLHGAAAIDTAGYVWITGDNDQYQHGIGNNNQPIYIPSKITIDSAGNAFNNVRTVVAYFVKNVSEGYNGFYAIKNDGTLWGWGRMIFGMRGDATAGADKSRPVQIEIPGGRQVQQIIAGQFAIALCTDGTVWVWGEGASSNNLGYSGTTAEKWYPHQLTGLSNIRQIAGGLGWNFALNNSNVLYGWGAYGERLGYANGLPVSTPTPLTNIMNGLPQPIKSIVTNSAVAHAILIDSTLWGWGDNGQGTVGNGQRIVFTIEGGNPFDRNNLDVVLPIQIAPGVKFDTVFGGSTYTYHTYARDVNDSLYCWGRGKASVLANKLRSASSSITATYGNSWDIAYPTPVDPFNIPTSYIQTSDYCVKISATGSPCNSYSIPSNTAPVANAGPDQNITTYSTTLDATGSSDNVYISRYEWKQIAGPSNSVIDLPASRTPTVRGLTDGSYVFQLLVEDNGWFLDSATVTINVNVPPNQSPTANAGADQTITLPTNTVTLNGSGTDPDGIISSYQWAKLTGPAQFTIVNATQGQTVVNNLVQGIYTFELTVTDNLGATGVDTVQVTVNAAPPSNQAPTANAGPDKLITLPVNTVTINGSGTDPDGTIASYQWTKLTGPSQYTIVSPAQAQTIINNLVQGIYTFRLTVTDNQGATGSDTVQVIVNAPPVSNAGSDRNITLPTNSTTLNGSGTDPDGTIVAYQWAKLSGPAQFVVISPANPQTVVNNLVEGVYIFELTVTDNRGATDTDTVQVTVNAALPPGNQTPTANAGNDQSITLPTNSVTVSGSGTDPDGTIVSYQWGKLTGPSQFVIVSADQASTVINSLVEGVYTFEFTVTDNQGATGSDTVQITVNAAPPPTNQAPTANAGSNQTITLPANTVTLNGSGTDPDGTIVSYQWTKLTGPTQYSITNADQAQTLVNNLVQGVYTFRLTVMDNQGATGVASVQITVNAQPANILPVANAGIDSTIVLPSNSITITGQGTDLDGAVMSYHWSKISGPVQYSITSPNTIQTTFADLVEGEYEFELAVTDDRGGIGRDTVTVTVLPDPRTQSTARIYPNPAVSDINIVIDAITNNNKTRIQIVNAAGNSVYYTEVMRSQQVVTVPVDVSRFPKGTYFVRLGTDINTNITLKFVKQ